MRKILGLAAGLIIGVISGAHAETVKIGIVEALSGPPVIVDFGESYLQGIQLAFKEYKASNPKRDIEIVVYNDEANPQRSVSLVQRLIASDQVSAIVGTVNAGSVVAFAPLAQQAGVPLMIGPATATDITTKFIDQKPSYIFRCSMVERFMTDAVLDWAVKHYKSIGMIHTTSGYGMFALNEVQSGMAARGRTLAAVEAAAPTVSDMTPQALKMKDAGVDLVLIYHDSPELIFRAFQKLDYKPATAAGWGLSSQMAVNVIGKEAIEGGVMAQAFDIEDPKAREFDAKMRAEFGDKYRWPVVAALGYDAMRLVLQAVDRAGGEPAKVRDALEETDNFRAVTDTPSHPFSAHNHECLEPSAVFLGVWRGGEVVRLAN
jgi:branched-chain amino acid transport system substrate-binding protein